MQHPLPYTTCFKILGNVCPHGGVHSPVAALTLCPPSPFTGPSQKIPFLCAVKTVGALRLITSLPSFRTALKRSRALTATFVRYPLTSIVPSGLCQPGGPSESTATPIALPAFPAARQGTGGRKVLLMIFCWGGVGGWGRGGCMVVVGV